MLSMHGGIDAVGFFQSAQAAGKVSDLSWVGYHHADLQRMGESDQGLFQAAGGFADQMQAAVFFEPGLEVRTDAQRMVFDFESGGWGIALQGGLGHVDTCVGGICVGRSYSALLMTSCAAFAARSSNCSSSHPSATAIWLQTSGKRCSGADTICRDGAQDGRPSLLRISA
jgi:hypothetical protein